MSAPALAIVGAVCRRTWLKSLRRPVLLTFSFGQPILWMLFFGFLFHRYGVDTGGRPLTYVDFLLPGVCAMTVLFGASQSGIGLIRDMQMGFLSRLLATPADSRLILGGKVLADVLRLLAQAAVVLGLGLLLGARVSVAPAAWLVAWLALGLFALAFCSLSCLIALRTRAQEAMAAYVHLVNMPMLFTSSALVPTRQMPDWLAALSQANPLTATVNAARGALLFGEMPSVWGCLLPLAVTASALFWWASLTLRRAETSSAG